MTPILLPAGKGLLNAGKLVLNADDCCCPCGCEGDGPDQFTVTVSGVLTKTCFQFRSDEWWGEVEQDGFNVTATLTRNFWGFGRCFWGGLAPVETWVRRYVDDGCTNTIGSLGGYYGYALWCLSGGRWGFNSFNVPDWNATPFWSDATHVGQIVGHVFTNYYEAGHSNFFYGGTAEIGA